jgi:hypothetical protein
MRDGSQAGKRWRAWSAEKERMVFTCDGSQAGKADDAGQSLVGRGGSDGLKQLEREPLIVVALRSAHASELLCSVGATFGGRS